MNTLHALAESELGSVHGGTGSSGDDSLARDIGQYVGGFYGSFVAHPFLSNLPLVGSFFSNWYGFRAMTQ